MVASVPPRHVLEARFLDEIDVHAGSAHERGGVAIGKGFERLLVRAVRAHDVGEDEHAAGFEAPRELLEQRHLVARVAEHLAGPHRVELTGPLGGEGVVDVTHAGFHEVVDAELDAARHVERVLSGAQVVAGHLATPALGHGVRAAAVSGSEIEDVAVGVDGLGPLHLGHHPLRGVVGALLDAVGGGLVDAEVNVVAAAAHDALIKHAGGLIVVLLEDLIGYLVLAELLVDKVSLRNGIRRLRSWLGME